MRRKIGSVMLILLLAFSAYLFFDYQKDLVTQNEFDVFFKQWKVYGIDVSEYNGNIQWEKVDKIFGEHPIHFVFIRSTAGKNKTDKKFHQNWEATKGENIFQGAYHYYRPNENSTEQANNFINNTKLNPGNLPPVLDIEKTSKTQSMESLKVGLQNWLDLVEAHYGIKPIIYSGSHYYTAFLKQEFADYPIWIANYNRTKKPVSKKWQFWQYSDKGRVEGIRRKVDINVFDGSLEELKTMCIH